MGDVYASVICTSVLQLKEIPPRPTEFDGALALFNLAEWVDEGKLRLATLLDKVALQQKPVRGDGHCQFRAVADQVLGSEHRYAEVRQAAGVQLEANPQAYSGFVMGDYREYVLGMAGKEWGDNVTLQAISDALMAQFLLVTDYQEEALVSVTPATGPPQGTFCLCFHAEVHYNLSLIHI